MTLATNLMMRFFMQQNAAPGARLPDEYQEVEWIESAGTSDNGYVDTGLTAADTDVYEVTAYALSDSFSGSVKSLGILGDGNTKTDSNFAIWLGSSSNSYSVEYSYGDGGNNNYKVIVGQGVVTTVEQWHTYKADLATGASYVDGVLMGTASSRSSYPHAKKLVFFATWRGTSANSKFKGRMAECVFWRNGAEIRRFVPCYRKSDNAVGFYDLCGSVSSTTNTPFYMGGGNSIGLSAGPDVTTETTTVYYRAAAKVSLYTENGVKSHTFDNGVGTVVLKGKVTEMPQVLRGTAITDVTLPASITGIGVNAFRDCTSLAMGSLPTGVTGIGGQAFYGCTSLALTSLPDSVTTIGPAAFRSCTSLALTSLPAGLTTIESNAFYGCTSLALTSLPAGVSVGYGAFAQCTGMTTLTLPYIDLRPGFAFTNCTGLVSVTFLDMPGDAAVGRAFNGCTNITDIYVPWRQDEVAGAPWGAANATVHYRASSVIPPGDEVWYYADAQVALYSQTDVVSHTFGNGRGVLKFASAVTTTGQWFRGVTDVRSVILPDSVTAIGANFTTGATSLRWVGMPGTVASMGSGAFRDCTSLGLASLPSSITAIPMDCFRECTSLALSSLPPGIVSIGGYSFLKCEGISLSSLPDGLASIGALAFQDCINITVSAIPASVSSIGEKAFQSCNAIASITFLGTPSTLGVSLFQQATGITDIYVPWDSTDAINANAPWGATSAVLHYNYIS